MEIVLHSSQLHHTNAKNLEQVQLPEVVLHKVIRAAQLHQN